MIRSATDYSRVRVFLEEIPRQKDHRPALVTNPSTNTINIIPTSLWNLIWEDQQIVNFCGTLCHECLHICLYACISIDACMALDLLPEPDWELHQTGVFGWGEAIEGGMKEWKWRS